MISIVSHFAVGLAITAIFVAGGFVVQLRVSFLRNLTGSVALGIAAAVVITAVRILG
jgi:hypothetical protein